MSKFSAITAYQHGQQPRIGVLLNNLGTPDAPEKGALRRYLKQFLSDPRVVEKSRFIWWPVLNLIILNVRPKRSAVNYAKVWTEAGSPLMVHSLAQTRALQEALSQSLASDVVVKLGMRYGSPSIPDAMEALREAGCTRIIVLPLYPQHSGSTTASVYDAVFDVLKGWRHVPELRCINEYFDDAGYIDALAASVKAYWAQHGQGDKLLFSFHGIPQRYFTAGDPYHCHCHATAHRVATRLGLAADRWQLTFQSRFGPEQWLEPATDKTLTALGEQGFGRVDVMCPGFASDCIETLEEIDMENREIYLKAGGGDFHYIPCLNSDTTHIDALANLVVSRIRDWDQAAQAATDQARDEARQRAMALGATN